MPKPRTFHLCYGRNGKLPRPCTAMNNNIVRTAKVRLLIDTFGGPSWQTVYLCLVHRNAAERDGRLKAAPRE